MHPDTKQLQEVTFYVASNGGSILLSCTTTLALSLIQPHSRLDYLPPRATLITSSVDHLKKTKCKSNVHVYKKERTKCNQPNKAPKLITSKDQILQAYLEVFEGIIKSLDHPTTYKSMQASPPTKTPCRPVPVHLKEQFKQEIDKMLQTGILRPVHQATPWINRFVLVEGKDKLGKLKLRICLDQPI